MIIEECLKCSHLHIAHNKIGTRFYICGQQCGKPANGGHPLSPCVIWGCHDDDPETGEEVTPDCYIDEDAINEGHRCPSYCGWLHAMHRAEARTHNCEECALSRRVTPAEYNLYWDQGKKYVCEDCYKKLTGAKQ